LWPVVVVVLLCTAPFAVVRFSAAQGPIYPFAQLPGPAVNAGFDGMEFDGTWAPTQSEDISTDTFPVDYMGLPLSEAGRTRALNFSESQSSMMERQCEGWGQPYILSGPFGLKFFSNIEPVKGTVVNYTIAAWDDRLPMVIWMDGRPHPSPHAEHTLAGFTTGHMEGNTLVTVTTNMKEGFNRKNGAVYSDLVKMTLRFIRHDYHLLVIGVIEDPVYQAEPLVLTRDFVLSVTPELATAPPCIVSYEGRPANSDVPHFLWGKKPAIDLLTEKYGVPQEAVLGYPETLYPEYRQKMNKH
jgi:hypothetical protein